MGVVAVLRAPAVTGWACPGLIIGADFIGASPSCLVLGDNIFFGHGITDLFTSAMARDEGDRLRLPRQRPAAVWGHRIRPGHEGCLHLRETQDPPLQLGGDRALFLRQGRRRNRREAQTFGPRELEITDVNRTYLKRGKLHVEIMGRGYAWLDTGTPDSLLEASEFVSRLERRQGFKISCPEEIAFRLGFIGPDQLERLAGHYGKSAYGIYLIDVLRASEGHSLATAEWRGKWPRQSLAHKAAIEGRVVRAIWGRGSRNLLRPSHCRGRPSAAGHTTWFNLY
jgi:glucose-1-phosphate thymidylyltransferase